MPLPMFPPLKKKLEITKQIVCLFMSEIFVPRTINTVCTTVSEFFRRRNCQFGRKKAGGRSADLLNR
jgi:hypothetical protein